MKAESTAIVETHGAFGFPWMVVHRSDGEVACFFGSDRFSNMAWWYVSTSFCFCISDYSPPGLVLSITGWALFLQRPLSEFLMPEKRTWSLPASNANKAAVSRNNSENTEILFITAQIQSEGGDPSSVPFIQQTSVTRTCRMSFLIGARECPEGGTQTYLTLKLRKPLESSGREEEHPTSRLCSTPEK